MVALILTLIMCALLFLMIWAAAYFYPWSGLLLFFPRISKKKPGMIFIFAMIMGILMLLIGMGPWPLLTCAIAGLHSELCFKSGAYKSAKKAVLSYGLFSMWIFGNYLPLFTDYEGYFAQRADYGEACISAVQKLMPLWMAPVLLIACFVCGVPGGLLGRALLKKHFEKAGLACWPIRLNDPRRAAGAFWIPAPSFFWCWSWPSS